MSIGTAPTVPGYLAQSGFIRLSVARYHEMIGLGALSPSDRIELLEGYMVQKMSQNPRHSTVSTNAEEVLSAARPAGWRMLADKPITLIDSEPEPDVTLARGDRTTYLRRHPGPGDIGLVVEVADTSLTVDRNDMGRIYARAALPVYWIINIIDRQIEVYTDPRPADPVPSYATRTDYKSGDSVPLVLDGQVVAQLPVEELLG